MHPLILWIRFPADRAWNESAWYLEAAPGVGFATLYYVPRGARGYAAAVFGMRVPFARRSVPSVIPALRIPPVDPLAPVYVRVSLDDESRIVPVMSLVDSATFARENQALENLSSIALLFIGIFISLAAANLFVFAFVRESSYVYYSLWMLNSSLFAATYVHNGAWKWLWPNASIPEEPVMSGLILAGGIFYIAFARSFLRSREIAPRADRIVTWLCVAVLASGVIAGPIAPSAYFIGPLIGRDVFLIGAVIFLLSVFALGVMVMLRGDKSSRFFVAANVATGLTACAVALENLFTHGPENTGAFVVFMTGSSIDGWILFAALAYRLREAVGEFVNEQQQRLVAQAEALVQARAALEQRQAAATDALTGIANRRSFDEVLLREWDRCARARAPLSLLMLDIDGFKAFNDTYGHVAGDDCLRNVAEAIARGARRPGDAVCRYGGEEFAVILGETNDDGARAVAQDVAQAVRSLKIAHRGTSLGYVTVSIGVGTVMPEPGSEPSIVECADANLYKAKTSGRNRWASSDRLDEAAPRADVIERRQVLGA